MNIDKIYRIGYCPGSFDLFHVGHVNLLRNAKKQCRYLIVGVVSDELHAFYKGSSPYISLDERMEVVASCRYADEVFTVDFTTADKLEAWKVLHYDCHFAGSDHVNDFDTVAQQLKLFDVDMVFFPYTRQTTSTKIREVVETRKSKVIYEA